MQGAAIVIKTLLRTLYVLKHHLGANCHDPFFPELRAKKTFLPRLCWISPWVLVAGRKLPCCTWRQGRQALYSGLPGLTPPPATPSPRAPSLVLGFCDGLVRSISCQVPPIGWTQPKARSWGARGAIFVPRGWPPGAQREPTKQGVSKGREGWQTE